ncbi:SdrH family protein, partial [Mammaliicoccus sciuri]
EPSTEEPSSNDSNHQDQVPPPNQSNSGKPSSEEPKTNEPNSNSNNDQNVNQYKPTMPAYPNTNEVGDGYYNPQYTDEKAPKFIPGHSEAYYSKLDEDVLELVTSKVGSRPDLAQPKFKKTNKTAETTSVDDDDTKTETTKTTTESFETASDHKDISKPLIIGISIAIVLVLGFIILFIMRRFSKS